MDWIRNNSSGHMSGWHTYVNARIEMLEKELFFSHSLCKHIIAFMKHFTLNLYGQWQIINDDGVLHVTEYIPYTMSITQFREREWVWDRGKLTEKSKYSLNIISQILRRWLLFTFKLSVRLLLLLIFVALSLFIGMADGSNVCMCVYLSIINEYQPCSEDRDQMISRTEILFRPCKMP